MERNRSWPELQMMRTRYRDCQVQYRTQRSQIVNTTRRRLILMRAVLLVTAFAICTAWAITGGRAARHRSPQDELDRTFDYELELCPGQEQTQRFRYPDDYVSREISPEDAVTG